MNKKLLTLAIGAAMVATPFVSAQAANANVEIYGKVNYSWDFVDNNDKDGTDADDDVTAVNRGSRIGFKGSESLSNGMKAFYLIESGLNGGAVGDRLTYVGLSGNFGTFTIGDQYKPYKLATARLDMFADTIADYNTVISPGAAGAPYEGAVNSVKYTSNNFSGLQFSIARASVQTSEAAGGNETEDVSASATYSAGPLYLGAGYENQQDAAGGGVGSDDTATKIGAGYSFGAFKVGAVWENVEMRTDNATDTEIDALVLNGSYKMGANTIKAAYGDIDNSAAGVSDGGTMTSLGLDHTMSSRTKVYAIYSTFDDDIVGTHNMSGATLSLAGQDQDAFSFGVVHTF